MEKFCIDPRKEHSHKLTTFFLIFSLQIPCLPLCLEYIQAHLEKSEASKHLLCSALGTLCWTKEQTKTPQALRAELAHQTVHWYNCKPNFSVRFSVSDQVGSHACFVADDQMKTLSCVTCSLLPGWKLTGFVNTWWKLSPRTERLQDVRCPCPCCQLLSE